MDSSTQAQRPLTSDDIDALIQLATSSRPTSGPLKDTRTQLFVGNLPYRVRWQDLKDLFRRAGTVLRADVSLGPDNRSRGYGTVLLATAEDAGRAIDMFHGYSWQTRILEVRPDRLPPDFDATVPPVFSASTPSLSARPPTEELNYSALLDFHHSLSANPCRNLFVGNLPFHCQWQDLKDLFRQAGTILRADVALGPDGRSRGFGTVSFATEIDAERAVKMFNGYEYNGRLLKVNFDKFMQMSQPSNPASPLLPTSIDQRTLPPAGLNSWPLSSGQIGRLNISPAQTLETPTSSSNSSPLPRDTWGLPLDITPPKLNDDRERELLQAFRNLELEGPLSSSPFNRTNHVPDATRSNSTSSSTKPPSLSTTTSSSSATSSSSLPTSATSPERTHAHPFSTRRSSSSSHNSKLSSSSPSSPPPPLPPFPRPQRANMSSRIRPSPRSSASSQSNGNPHRPGPIVLPPPPSLVSLQITAQVSQLSPGQQMGMSPLHSPAMHHPLLQQQQNSVSITPHGLPPMTPSMPSFNFIQPPLPSPGLPPPGFASSPYHLPIAHPHNAMPLPSPPTIRHHPYHTHHAHHISPFGMTLVSPLPSPSVHSASTVTSASATHSFHTPSGVPFSPGAFWGRPGAAGAVNPTINPAVGAPVHAQANRSVMSQMSPGLLGSEPQGYFEGYFPLPGDGGSTVENEILKDPKSLRGKNGMERRDGAEGECEQRREDEDGHDEDNADSVAQSDSEAELEEVKVGGRIPRRHSTNTKDVRPWESNFSVGNGDLRIRETHVGNGYATTGGGIGKSVGSGAEPTTLARAHSTSTSAAKHRGGSNPRGLKLGVVPHRASSQGDEQHHEVLVVGEEEEEV